MTDTLIAAGEGRTTMLEMTGDDTLTIEQFGAIVVDAANPLGGAAVLLNEPVNGLEIDNAGLIYTFSSDSSGSAEPAIEGHFGTGEHNFTILNRATGIIRSEGTAIDIETGGGSTGEVVLDNAGIIESLGGRAVDFTDVVASSVTIINRAGAIIRGEGSDILRPGDGTIASLVIYNAGFIGEHDSPRDAGGDAIDFQESGGTVRNGATGVIEGGRHGITGDVPILVINEAGGQITGRNGAGINMDTTGADPATVVVNRGSILGDYNPDDFGGEGDGDGVDVDGILDLRNYLYVTGNGADNEDNFADGVAAGGGSIINYAGAEIWGNTNGILIDNSDGGSAFAATNIVNRGSIQGAYEVPHQGFALRLVGDWNDRLTSSGELTSHATTNAVAVDMGGGNDVVKLQGASAVTGQIWLGAGDDSFMGAAEGEQVLGGLGSDKLRGGDGNDVFVYTAVTDSRAGAAFGIDRIMDFATGDLADVSLVDADAALAGDQAFTVVGSFTNTAGEAVLTYDAGADVTYFSGDVNGDGKGDLVIQLNGERLEADFVL